MYKEKEISIWNLVFGVVILYIIMPIRRCEIFSVNLDLL